MKILYGLAAIAAVLIGVWFYLFPTYHHRYKMTVEIEADGAVHTGVGMVDVRAQWQEAFARLIAGDKVTYSVTGRAALVDLGKKGVVLALLESPGGLNYSPEPPAPEHVALIAYYGPQWWLDVKRKLKAIPSERSSKTLDESAYPVFVWLPDPKKREGAVPVQPRDMPRVIDSSVHLKSVKIEMTNAAFIDELFVKLPWLATQRDHEIKNMTLVDPRNFKLVARQLLGVL